MWWCWQASDSLPSKFHTLPSTLPKTIPYFSSRTWPSPAASKNRWLFTVRSFGPLIALFWISVLVLVKSEHETIWCWRVLHLSFISQSWRRSAGLPELLSLSTTLRLLPDSTFGTPWAGFDFFCRGALCGWDSDIVRENSPVVYSSFVAPLPSPRTDSTISAVDLLEWYWPNRIHRYWPVPSELRSTICPTLHAFHFGPQEFDNSFLAVVSLKSNRFLWRL